MIDAELMIIFHIYQCGIHVPDVTIKEVVTKSMLCCNYKFNFLQYTSLFKSVLKIYIFKLNFCGSLFKKKGMLHFNQQTLKSYKCIYNLLVLMLKS